MNNVTTERVQEDLGTITVLFMYCIFIRALNCLPVHNFVLLQL